MELIKDLTGSLFWAAALSIILYVAGSMAIGLLEKNQSCSSRPAPVSNSLSCSYPSRSLFISGAEDPPRDLRVI